MADLFFLDTYSWISMVLGGERNFFKRNFQHVEERVERMECCFF